MKRTFSEYSVSTTPSGTVRLPPKKRAYNRPRRAIARAALGEWKYLDTPLSSTMNTTTTMTLLNGMQQGPGASQRVGQTITLRSLEIRGYCAADTQAVNGQIVRYLVFLDRQANGAVPAAATDILSTNNVAGMRALTYRKRFKIILDKTYQLGIFAGDESQAHFHHYLKFRRPIKQEFNVGNAGTVADIATNSMYLLVLGTEAPGNTDALYAMNVRLRYTDQ